MGESVKQRYERPSVEVLEIIQENVICASPTGMDGSPMYNSMNNEETW